MTPEELRQLLQNTWGPPDAAATQTQYQLFQQWVNAAIQAGDGARITEYFLVDDTSFGDDARLVRYYYSSIRPVMQVDLSREIFEDISPSAALHIGDAIIEFSIIYAREFDELRRREEYEKDLKRYEKEYNKRLDEWAKKQASSMSSGGSEKELYEREIKEAEEYGST